MFTRRTLTVWTGIILLSSMFLMGEESAWAPGDVLYCEDVDGDGYGVRPALLCPFLGLLDCDDTNPAVHPRAPEVCNGIDDNCDSVIDVVDKDGDGYFDATPPCGGNDCNDNYSTVYPGATEICDGLDNDCDGIIPVVETDGDGDHYVACDPWTGTVSGILGGNDCDDSEPAVNPGVNESPYGDPVCADGLDNDCDTQTDSADNGCQQCSVAADCDDANPCTDDDCVDSLCSYTNNTLPCDDGDACTTNDTCDAGVCTGGPPLDGDSDGYVSDACPGGNDCLDSNADVNPGAIEGPPGDPTCSDGLDNDCDGQTDDAADPDCVVTQ